MSAGDFTQSLQVRQNAGKASIFNPRLGRFAQPDTIISNPLNSQTLNRFSYVLNSPILNIDPSGNIVICFYGGLSEGTETRTADLCSVLYGDRFSFVNANSNAGSSVKASLLKIINALASNPDEEVIILGYSWGGAAALELVNLLDAQNIDVDELVLVDPMLIFRGIRSEYANLVDSKKVTDFCSTSFCHSYSLYSIPDNVMKAYNFYATRSVQADLTLDEAKEFALSVLLQIAPPVSNFEGAINIGIDQDHNSIINQSNLISQTLLPTTGGGGGSNVKRLLL